MGWFSHRSWGITILLISRAFAQYQWSYPHPVYDPVRGSCNGLAQLAGAGDSGATDEEAAETIATEIRHMAQSAQAKMDLLAGPVPEDQDQAWSRYHLWMVFDILFDITHQDHETRWAHVYCKLDSEP